MESQPKILNSGIILKTFTHANLSFLDHNRSIKPYSGIKHYDVMIDLIMFQHIIFDLQRFSNMTEVV